MVVCGIVYVFLVLLIWLNKKGKFPKEVEKEEKRRLFLIMLVSNTIAMALFTTELLGTMKGGEITRNTYGGGSRTESYQATIEGEVESEPLQIEVEERAYTSGEIQEIFQKMMKELDRVVLGENQSRDRVDKNLNLVDSLEGYPVKIEWELDNYEVLGPKGEIVQEATVPEGTLVEVKGILTYGLEEAVYVTHAMIYPRTKTAREKWVDKLVQAVKETEEDTRQQESFILPVKLEGKQVTWKKAADMRGYYVLLLGAVGCVLLFWKKKQDEKEAREKCVEQMIRDYPDIIGKFTLLLGTGMTMKHVWTKIIQEYEEQKNELGCRAAYEEMRTTYHEMQSGIPEAEAYERFGRRCGVALYMKLGALLSQNLRKGSKGLSQLLKLESIQAMENRKSRAKRMGEEASTKLLLPMFAMLAVVMILVIVPAFLSIQL